MQLAAAAGRLVSYFRVYGPSRFATAAGVPMGRRALQKKINQFQLPVILVARGDPLIDPAAADAQLSKFAQAGYEPRRPGRPRKIQS
jgi:hypothetical protein